MLDKMTGHISFQSQALVLRGERQRVIASNIANADTPGYQARDFQFAEALKEATGMRSGVSQMPMNGSASTMGANTDAGHMPIGSGTSTVKLGYSVQTQPSLDNNTVDLNQQRANFVDNAVRYEATLRFINGAAKTMLSAIQGQ